MTMQNLCIVADRHLCGCQLGLIDRILYELVQPHHRNNRIFQHDMTIFIFVIHFENFGNALGTRQHRPEIVSIYQKNSFYLLFPECAHILDSLYFRMSDRQLPSKHTGMTHAAVEMSCFCADNTDSIHRPDDFSALNAHLHSVLCSFKHFTIHHVNMTTFLYGAIITYFRIKVNIKKADLA